MSEEPQTTLEDDFTDEDQVQSFPFWNYKEENTILGTFVKWEKDGYGEHAVLNTGMEEVHLPNLTALNGKLNSRTMEVGTKVKVVFIEEVKSKKSGRVYADFNVYVK